MPSTGFSWRLVVKIDLFMHQIKYALKDFLNSWLTRDENRLLKIRKDKA